MILILFAATIVRSAFGFGEALFAVPLLALVMPIEVAAPTAVLVSITVALVILIQDWRRVHASSALWLVVPTFLGIPLGLVLLKTLPEPIVEAILGVVVLAFSLHALAGRRNHELKDDRLAGFFGFTAGVLGGAYGMNGPPLAIYGSLRRWSPEHFRATLQAYFLPASLAGMGGYWFGGLWTPAVNRFYLVSLPGVLVGDLSRPGDQPAHAQPAVRSLRLSSLDRDCSGLADQSLHRVARMEKRFLGFFPISD